MVAKILPRRAEFPEGYELVPINFRWRGKGNEIAVHILIDDAKDPIRLDKYDSCFETTKLLKPGIYRYRFVVDGTIKFAADQPITTDYCGNVTNWIKVHVVYQAPHPLSIGSLCKSSSSPELVKLAHDETSQRKAGFSGPALGAEKAPEFSESCASAPSEPETTSTACSDSLHPRPDCEKATFSSKRRRIPLGRATSVQEKELPQDDSSIAIRRSKMHSKVTFNPFDAVVQFFQVASRRTSVEDWEFPWARDPHTPHSIPDTPTGHPGMLWYNINELPYLVRARLDSERFRYSFNRTNTHEHVQLTRANTCATKSSAGLYRSARAVLPIPPDALSYFEIQHNLPSELRGLCVGLSTSTLPLNALVGSRTNSIGLYSSGELVRNGTWSASGPGMKPGVTIGCLVRLYRLSETIQRAHVTFFQDGILVGEPERLEHFLDVPIDASLFPTVSLYSAGSSVSCHFAAEDIAFRNQLPPNTRSLDQQVLRFGRNLLPFF